MRSLFIIEYRMRGGLVYEMSIHAECLATALEEFHSRMAGHGCERDKYSIITHRQILEKLTA